METLPADPSVLALRMVDAAAGAMQDLRRRVVEQVNWEVAKGDYWAVAGLQGSGKSDFLMMTAGVSAPASGGYWLFGQEMPIFDQPRLAERLRVGLVFDGGRLFNHLTVGENVALPLRYHKNLTAAGAHESVAKMLEATGLTPWAESTPGAVGRNVQKRVGLARALMLRPQLLLVDDPLGGLDVRHAHWWLDFLDQLSSGHPILDGVPLTLVVTTADLRPWKHRARQFAVLREHRLVVLGNRSQLEAAGDQFVTELLSREEAGG